MRKARLSPSFSTFIAIHFSNFDDGLLIHRSPINNDG
jgi:hypothetical protein